MYLALGKDGVGVGGGWHSLGLNEDPAHSCVITEDRKPQWPKIPNCLAQLTLDQAPAPSLRGPSPSASQTGVLRLSGLSVVGSSASSIKGVTDFVKGLLPLPLCSGPALAPAWESFPEPRFPTCAAEEGMSLPSSLQALSI